jgi:hypothetical protein
MTVTIVTSRYPRELFKYIAEDESCAVKGASPGIYRIAGYWPVVQVIESKKLPPEENVWLKGLSSDLNVETAGIILNRKNMKEPDIAAYLYAVLQANPETVQEVLRMGKRGELTLDEVLEKAGLTAEWEAIGEARGEKTAWEKVITLLKEGYTVDQLEQMTPGGFTQGTV